MEQTPKDTSVGGRLKSDEKEQWKHAAERDGFKTLWTWVCYLVRNRIREQKREHTMYPETSEKIHT